MYTTSTSIRIMFKPMKSPLLENESHVRVTRILIFESVLGISRVRSLENIILLMTHMIHVRKSVVNSTKKKGDMQ